MKRIILSSVLLASVAALAEVPSSETPHYFINGRFVIQISGEASDFVLQTRASENDS